MASRKVLVPLGLLSVTTTERDALASPAAGFTIYNSTTGVVESYGSSSWPSAPVDITALPSGSDTTSSDRILGVEAGVPVALTPDQAAAGVTKTGTGAIVRATSPALVTPTGIVESDVASLVTDLAARVKLAGAAGGQTVNGGTGNSENLLLQSNSGTNAGTISLVAATVSLGGNPTNVAALSVGTGAGGAVVLNVTAAATNDDVNEAVLAGRVTTTAATVTSLMTWSNASYADDIVWCIEAKVYARRTGGVSGTAGDVASYGRVATFKDIAGTTTQVGTTTALWDHESQAGWDCTFDVNANNIRLRVTGAASNDVVWHALCTHSVLST